MNYAKAMSTIKSYYGPYDNEFIEEVVLKTLLSIPENHLEGVLDKLMSTVPRRKDFNPVGKDVIMQAAVGTPKDRDREIEREAIRWWNDINKRTNYMRDCQIGDIRAQEAIETMGGWVRFCTRTVRDESGKDVDVWNQKRFVELFKMFTYSPPEAEIKVLRGESEDPGEMRAKKMIMIGDIESCKQISAGSMPKEVFREIDNMVGGMKV